MPRKTSSIAPDWWDYTTLDDEIIHAAACLTPEQMLGLSRPGFRVVFYDTLEEFYLAEALEYITAWKQSTADNPVGICGPIGPTEQLPLVARLVNELNLSLKTAHFWGMDEWFHEGREVPASHPLSFERADRELCFNRIRPELVMQAEKVSIWHAGTHDNPFGQRLTTWMIANRIADTSVPMSLLADHPNLQFNFYRGGLGACGVQMR